MEDRSSEEEEATRREEVMDPPGVATDHRSVEATDPHHEEVMAPQEEACVALRHRVGMAMEEVCVLDLGLDRWAKVLHRQATTTSMCKICRRYAGKCRPMANNEARRQTRRCRGPLARPSRWTSVAVAAAAPETTRTLD